MNTKTKTLTAIAVAAALGGTALAGASYAGHRGGGHAMGFLDKGQLALSAMEMFDAIDADGDGKLTQAEIDKARNDRHGAHDANGDGSLSLEEVSPRCGTRPRARSPCARSRMLDSDGDAVVSRAEYDRPLAEIVERLDRDGDGGLSMRDHRHDDDDDRGGWWDDD